MIAWVKIGPGFYLRIGSAGRQLGKLHHRVPSEANGGRAVDKLMGRSGEQMEISAGEAVKILLQTINGVWLNGRVEDLAPMVHPEIVMVFPGFAGRIQGREQFLASFREFCENARVYEFHDHDYQSDLVGDTAVATFEYEMLYELSGERYQASGRDLWVFRHQQDKWVAVWRTMLEVQEQPAAFS